MLSGVASCNSTVSPQYSLINQCKYSLKLPLMFPIYVVLCCQIKGASHTRNSYENYEASQIASPGMVCESVIGSADNRPSNPIPWKRVIQFSIFNSFAFDRTWWCEWEYWWLLFLLIGMLIIDIHLLLVYYWSCFIYEFWVLDWFFSNFLKYHQMSYMGWWWTCATVFFV